MYVYGFFSLFFFFFLYSQTDHWSRRGLGEDLYFAFTDTGETEGTGSEVRN